MEVVSYIAGGVKIRINRNHRKSLFPRKKTHIFYK